MNTLILQVPKEIISNPIKSMVDVAFGENKTFLENAIKKSIIQIQHFLSLEKEIFEEIFEADEKTLKNLKKIFQDMIFGKNLLKYAQKITKKENEYKDFFGYAHLFYEKIEGFIFLIDEYLKPMIDEDSPAFKKFLVETADKIIEKKEKKVFNNLNDAFHALQN